jgi:prolyl-tRNA synthetase
MASEITSREKDYAQWYNDLILKGGLADYSAVRGCMVIKPYGFSLWENIRDVLDKMFKDTGHQNAYLKQKRKMQKVLPKNVRWLRITD